MRRRTLALTAAGLAGVVAQEWIARTYYARTSPTSRFVDEVERTAWPAPWHELWAPLERLRLAASPVSRAHGLPRGDGTPVLLVAGFMLRGGYLRTLRDWLMRLGYRAQIADIGRAADCYDVLTERLLRAVHAVADGPVHLIGHSMGGLVARAAAGRTPDRVASVAVLGTPLRGLRVHPGVRVTVAAVRLLTHMRRGAAVRPRCLTLACDCESVRVLRAPLPPRIRQLAIVSPQDGILDWRYGADEATMLVRAVPGSHTGLVWNVHAYRALAEHLATAGSGAAVERSAHA